MEYLQQAYFSNLNPVCREGGRFALQPGQTWAMQEHTSVFNKFYFFLSGSCRITIESNTYKVKAGDWFFIPAGVRHSYTSFSSERFEKYWMHFDLYPNDSLPRLLHLPYLVRVGSDSEPGALFKSWVAANDANILTDRLRAKAALLSLLVCYLELSHIRNLPVLSEEDLRISEVLAYIHNHLEQPLNNQLLSSICHMHPSHFVRFFSKKTGQPPANYVLQCRMDMARHLLIQTDLPVSQVAERVGIPDQSHFARLFRRYCAMTPTQCRNQHNIAY